MPGSSSSGAGVEVARRNRLGRSPGSGGLPSRLGPVASFLNARGATGTRRGAWKRPSERLGRRVGPRRFRRKQTHDGTFLPIGFAEYLHIHTTHLILRRTRSSPSARPACRSASACGAGRGNCFGRSGTNEPWSTRTWRPGWGCDKLCHGAVTSHADDELATRLATSNSDRNGRKSESTPFPSPRGCAAL